MNTIATELDHIVVAARTLDEGRAWALETLGVEAVGGGRHDGLATHNTLPVAITTGTLRLRSAATALQSILLSLYVIVPSISTATALNAINLYFPDLV